MVFVAGASPPTTFLESLNDFPDPPVQFYTGGGSRTLNRSRMLVATGTSSLLGWDLGASQGEVLIVIGDTRPQGAGPDNDNICFSSVVPSSVSTPANSNLYILEVNSNRYSVVDAGGGFTVCPAGCVPPPCLSGFPTFGSSTGIAAYYKASTGAIKFFRRCSRRSVGVDDRNRRGHHDRGPGSLYPVWRYLHHRMGRPDWDLPLVEGSSPRGSKISTRGASCSTSGG